MSAQIIALPIRSQKPSSRRPEIVALVGNIESLLDKRDAMRAQAMPQREISKRVHRILRLANEWGVGHLVVAAGRGGAA